MAFHEFGVMKKAPAWEEMYEKYDLSLCGETAAVEDDEVHALWEHFGSIPCFWHSLQRPAQGLAYTGITLIPPITIYLRYKARQPAVSFSASLPKLLE